MNPDFIKLWTDNASNIIDKAFSLLTHIVMSQEGGRQNAQ